MGLGILVDMANWSINGYKSKGPSIELKQLFTPVYTIYLKAKQ